MLPARGRGAVRRARTRVATPQPAWTSATGSLILDLISESPIDILESERLARRWFALVEERAFDQLGDLVHDDVVLVSKVRPGVVLEGKGDVAQFVRDALPETLYEAVTTSYLPLDETRIVVEGRLRWIDDDRVIRDDPVTWAMEFRDGLLARLVPARTRVEAETVLASPS